jgi:hypothetical protein
VVALRALGELGCPSFCACPSSGHDFVQPRYTYPRTRSDRRFIPLLCNRPVPLIAAGVVRVCYGRCVDDYHYHDIWNSHVHFLSLATIM